MDTPNTRPKDDQNFWHFALFVFYATLLIGGAFILWTFERLPISISFFDFALMSLATFRLTRLVVYDVIMDFFRDWFLVRKVSYTEGNEMIITREKYPDGVRRTMSDLISCPWCTGLQASFFVVFFYYLSPLTWIVLLVLAVGGVGTFLQVLANATGWKAEKCKQECQKIG